MVLLILLQSGKGGSLGIMGGGGNTQYGASTMDIVTKLTYYAGAAFFTLAVLAAIAFAKAAPTSAAPVEEPDGLEQQGLPLDSDAGGPASPAPVPNPVTPVN